ncbi:hypothetical protein PMIN01_01144 [Paraphaeosphaeria minitans]|uniref:Uncharacterized protein n=1 Tax=Paraphaeosphaeria minitans TaxID=565426 RepID=A0A9P6GW24_9PLEO|nr:hypothetical protein PMIN01_01144 [Paraphaeosphaeria minitans]
MTQSGQLNSDTAYPNSYHTVPSSPPTMITRHPPHTTAARNLHIIAHPFTSLLTHIWSSMHRPHHARRTPLHPCSFKSLVAVSAIASCDKVPFQGPLLCLRTVRDPCWAGAVPV